jgi:hypothetical protein
MLHKHAPLRSGGSKKWFMFPASHEIRGNGAGESLGNLAELERLVGQKSFAQTSEEAIVALSLTVTKDIALVSIEVYSWITPSSSVRKTYIISRFQHLLLLEDARRAIYTIALPHSPHQGRSRNQGFQYI